MDSELIVGIIVTGAVGLLIIIMAIVLLTGRGAWMIAGYNTMPKEKKEKYDEAALCKFIGKITLPIGIATPMLLAIELKPEWSVYGIVGFIALVFGIVLFALIYLNTGNRFKK